MSKLNDIIKNKRLQKKLLQTMNQLKKRLFEQHKKITTDICDENYLYNKKELIYTHNFLADQEVNAIVEDLTNIKKWKKE